MDTLSCFIHCLEGRNLMTPGLVDYTVVCIDPALRDFVEEKLVQWRVMDMIQRRGIGYFESRLPYFQNVFVEDEMGLLLIARAGQQEIKNFFYIAEKHAALQKRRFFCDFEFRGLDNGPFTLCIFSIPKKNLHWAFWQARLLEPQERNFDVASCIDSKTLGIYKKVHLYMDRFPQYFDSDLLNFMHYFLAFVPSLFRSLTSKRYLTFLIASLYRMKRAVTRENEHKSKRWMRCKLVRRLMLCPFEEKWGVGVLIAYSALDANERFTRSHALPALQAVYPQLRPTGAINFIQNDQESGLLYFEVEDPEKDISLKQISALKHGLHERLQGRVQRLTRSLFIPQNEEEVLRNMLTVSQQLKYVKDLPQAMIVFDRYDQDLLVFKVTLARLVLHETPLSNFFQKIPCASYAEDRVKIMGFVRKKYLKQVSVFELSFSAFSFLRPDQSVDVYRARLHVVEVLERALGSFRDYNGGMLAQQNALLVQMQKDRDKSASRVERFFHGLHPMDKRGLFPPSALLFFFDMSEKYIKAASNQAFVRSHGAYVVGLYSRPMDFIKCALKKGDLYRHTLFLKVPDLEKVYFGCICFCNATEKRKRAQAILRGL